MAAPGVKVETHIFKVVNGLELTIDVHTPKDFNAETGLSLLHFHGGFLIIGEKTTFPPNWLLKASLHHNWVYATASYRLLPEASGTDILTDALHATQWIHARISKRIILAGSSAGGYLALATATNPQCPPLVALLSIYGMVDLTNSQYLEASPGTSGLPQLSAADLNAAIEEIVEAKERGSVIDAYLFPAVPPADKRFKWISALHQKNQVPDLISGIPGLAQQIRSEGVEIIPQTHRRFFPAVFGLSDRLPPVVLLHGSQDVHVFPDQSTNVAERLRALDVEVLLEEAVGQGHGFDVRGIPADVDIHTKIEGEPKFYDNLRRVFEFLEKCADGS